MLNLLGILLRDRHAWVLAGGPINMKSDLVLLFIKLCA